jgi:hypothetical protein
MISRCDPVRLLVSAAFCRCLLTSESVSEVLNIPSHSILVMPSDSREFDRLNGQGWRSAYVAMPLLSNRTMEPDNPDKTQLNRS